MRVAFVVALALWPMWALAAPAVAPATRTTTSATTITTTTTTSPGSAGVAPASSGGEGSQQGEEPGAVQSEPPTLESRIPPVSGQAFTKKGKFEISVGVGFSLNDAFWEKLMPELSLGYHIDENFYVGLRGGYAANFSAGHVNACDSSGTTCGAPTNDQLSKLPGNISGLVAVQFAWTPIYGKMNFFGEKVLHFDTSLLIDGGALILGVQPDPSGASVAPEFAPGVGWRFFFTPAFALSSEIRDIVYVSDGLQNQVMFHLGLTFLL